MVAIAPIASPNNNIPLRPRIRTPTNPARIRLIKRLGIYVLLLPKIIYLGSSRSRKYYLTLYTYATKNMIIPPLEVD